MVCGDINPRESLRGFAAALALGYRAGPLQGTLADKPGTVRSTVVPRGFFLHPPPL